MLSHDNMLFTAASLLNEIKAESTSAFPHVFISFLPLSQSTGQTMEIIMPILLGATVQFFRREALAKTTLLDRIRQTRPTIFFASPAIWHTIRKSALTG